MRSIVILIGTCAFLLNGCNFIHALLPRRSTTSVEARATLERCGIDPDKIAWRVSEDGTFEFGTKSADAPPMTDPQARCLVGWVDENRIKVAFIGWESRPN